MEWAIGLDCECLKYTHKALLMYLAYRHNEATGLCFPEAQTIRKETKISKNVLPKILHELRRMGFIRQYEVRARGKTHTYYILCLYKTQPNANWASKSNISPPRLTGG